MPTAQKTAAGEALRTMLPAGADPYAAISLAAHTAFLVRDRDPLAEIADMVSAHPQRAAELIVTLAALVDVDSSPGDMLAWLGSADMLEQDTVRTLAALTEARREVAAEAADALTPVTAESIALLTACQPEDSGRDVVLPVTLETMRALTHAARVAGVVQPCGTDAAYVRHLDHGEEACVRCTEAHALRRRATPAQLAMLKVPPLVAVECGTLAGYDTHIRAGQDPCPECMAAVQRSLAGLLPPPVECGTVGGVDAHRQNGEQPCRQCMTAARQALADLPASCGTIVGYDAHVRAGRKPCERCVDAVVAAVGQLPMKQRPQCGERAGYVAHKRAGEQTCGPCTLAQRRYSLEQYDKRLAREGKPPRRPNQPYKLPTPGRPTPDGDLILWPDSLGPDMVTAVTVAPDMQAA